MSRGLPTTGVDGQTWEFAISPVPKASEAASDSEYTSMNGAHG